MTSQSLSGISDHALIGEAARIPVSEATAVMSIAPLILSTPHRIVNLHLRVSAPTTGTKLPIILLSHGQGKSNHLSSLNGYAPLVNFWASHGFVVIQPTHMSSKALSLDPSTPGAPFFWRSRAEDISTIIDRLDEIETSVPFLAHRLDHTRIVVAGHSMGGHTAGMLLGQTLTDPDTGEVVSLVDTRIKAGILLTPPGDGKGGADLTEFASNGVPFFRNPHYETMVTPALVVVGSADDIKYLSPRGPEWHEDPYHLSPGPKALFKLEGGKHCLGGISGYDVAETTEEDEIPERAAVVQRLTWAYFRSVLYPEDGAWEQACKVFTGLGRLGSITSK